jgi:hypothetical protein
VWQEGKMTGSSSSPDKPMILTEVVAVMCHSKHLGGDGLALLLLYHCGACRSDVTLGRSYSSKD